MLAKSSLGKLKSSTCILVMLISAVVFLSFSATVEAQTNIGSLNPTSGNVGVSVQLLANISTQDGRYMVKFDEVNVTSGSAIGKQVVATFSVPNTYAGDHTVKLLDENTSESDTATFKVLTKYFVEVPALPSPMQRQEGDSTNISVGITGGNADKTYYANVTVQTPANKSYQKTVDVFTSPFGNVSALLSYPKDFPAGANTNFTGTYTVLFNGTLDKKTFVVGLTNATQYHRKQLVDIKAVYRAGENVTIKIVGTGVNHVANSTANSTTGIVRYNNWSVPSTASIGSYKVTVTSISINLTSKNPPDAQNFTVPGFEVNVTVRNRAGEPVKGVSLRVYENGKSLANRTTNTKGMVYPALTLEIGNYTGEAYYRDSKVGKDWLNITAAESRDFYCNLTNLRITVTDEADNRIPEVKMYLTRENLTLTTFLNGSAVAHSLVPNVSYTLNASRYVRVFNITTIQQLPITDWYDVKIICPKVKLQILVTDIKGNPVSNATVKVQEMMGGAPYEGRTVNGFVAFNSTFGNYTARIYVNGIKLNETIIGLFQSRNVSINCVLYGVSLTIRIVDYFGQPISNVNVKLQREGLSPYSLRTNATGAAAFSDLIGGDMQVSIYLGDDAQPFTVASYTVSSPTTFEIRLDGYISLAGFLVQTSQLATALVIIVVLLVVLVAEVRRTRRVKSQKSS
jgi:hypothetical protein